MKIIHHAVFEKQRVAAKKVALIFSISVGSNVHLKTYLVQPMVLYTLTEFEGRCSSGGREKVGVPNIFDPQQSRPPAGDTPESR
jgi:hypothetical protein